MPGIIIDKDDLQSIIGALISVADSGMCLMETQANAHDAQQLTGLCNLIARLLRQTGDVPNAKRYEWNANECARMVAAYELAKIAGGEADVTVRVGT